MVSGSMVAGSARSKYRLKHGSQGRGPNCCGLLDLARFSKTPIPRFSRQGVFWYSAEGLAWAMHTGNFLTNPE